MSAKDSQSSGESSGESSPLLPITSQQFTQIFSLEEEYSKGDEESSNEDSLFSEEEESLEDDQYPEEGDSLEDDQYLEEGDSLEDDQYLEEGDSLEDDQYLEESDSLEDDQYLEEDDYPEEENLYEEGYLERELKETSSSQTPSNLNARSPAAGVSQVTTLLTVHPPISELASKSSYYDTKSSTSFTRDAGGSPSWQDQSTQTEHIYGTKAPSKLKLKIEQEASTIIIPSLKLDSEECSMPEVLQQEKNAKAVKIVSQRKLWDGILNEPTDTVEVKGLKDSLFKSSYHSVFKTMVKEMAAHNELEEDIDIPLTGHLESETRRKLVILLKTNLENYKEVIHWIMKKRANLLSHRAPELITCSYCLHDQSPQIEQPKKKEVKKPDRIVTHEKKFEIDREWVKSNIKNPSQPAWSQRLHSSQGEFMVGEQQSKLTDSSCLQRRVLPVRHRFFSRRTEGRSRVHEGDVKLILYPNENVFRILFPDGSGQIYYPSGNLAMLILSAKESTFTFIILEDSEGSEKTCIRALINNNGHVTFYDENREIWLSLSQNLGYYFAKGKHQKAWNWWNLDLHVHAPPVQSISLNINQYIKIQIRSQDKIIFCFTHQTKHICLNLGTKYKFITPEMQSEMKNKALLEVEFSSTARKIQVLLRKMSRILNFLTIYDLKNFLENNEILLVVENMRKLSYFSKKASCPIVQGFSSTH